MTEIEIEAPLAEMIDYAPHLDSLTGGQGAYTMEFLRYDEVPPQLVQNVIAESAAQNDSK